MALAPLHHGPLLHGAHRLDKHLAQVLFLDGRALDEGERPDLLLHLLALCGGDEFRRVWDAEIGLGA